MKASIKEIKTEPGKPDADTIYKIQSKKFDLLQEVRAESKTILSTEQLNTWAQIMTTH